MGLVYIYICTLVLEHWYGGGKRLLLLLLRDERGNAVDDIHGSKLVVNELANEMVSGW